ncbi:MAG: hypothetical protein ACAH80_15040 [Alphaproteobacteria bacterium]
MGAPPAQAGPVVVNTAATSAATAAAAAAAAANARHNREAVSNMIANPTENTIAYAKNRGQVDWTTIPYIHEAVREMHIPAGTKGSQITEAQRMQFHQLLKEKRLVAQMSADTRADAEAKGLPQSLSQYFEISKDQAGLKGPVTLAQANTLHKTLEDKHWENDTKPAMQAAGLIGGGAVVVLGAGYAFTRRRRDGYGY